MDYLISGMLAIAFVVALVASWATHVIVCIQAAKWGLLIAGAIFFPVGMVHGAGTWFGFFQ